MTEPAPAFAFEATPVQERLMQLILDGACRIIGFGGGIRGTKTWGSLSVLIALCRIFPGSRWAVIRKDLERIRKNTLPSFNKLIARTGGFVGPVNKQTFEATCTNGSVILFHGENLDKDPDLDRWKGFEVNGFLLEEADELSERAYFKSIERAGAWILPHGPQPNPYVFCTFNPCPNWPKRVFYDPWLAGALAPPYAFIPSTIADNPYAPAAYRESLRELPSEEYRRFVEGDWTVLAGRYYETLNKGLHLLDRAHLPVALPPWWEYWGAFDWGYSHWAVFGAFARDADGVSYLLDSCWVRKAQDDEIAHTIHATMPARCLQEVYAGHDCWSRTMARGATGVQTFEVFAGQRIYLLQADDDRVNGGRAVRRALEPRGEEGHAKTPQVYLIDTPNNQRVFTQLSETMPDDDNIDKPAKVDCDTDGRGGDDGADMFRYGVATRLGTPTRPRVHADNPDRDAGLVEQRLSAFRPQAKRPRYVQPYRMARPWETA